MYKTINGTVYKVQVIKEGDRLYKKFRYKTVTLNVLEELIEQDYSNHYYWESVMEYVINEK
jgi:hypothetical protein